MKKLLVLFWISLAFVFSGCEEIFDDPASSENENYAHYRIAIKNGGEWNKYFFFTVSADPPTNYIHVEIGSVAQEGGKGSYEFKLPLDIYEGETVYLKLYTGPNFKEAKYKKVREILVEKTNGTFTMFFNF